MVQPLISDNAFAAIFVTNFTLYNYAPYTYIKAGFLDNIISITLDCANSFGLPFHASFSHQTND